jgi:hypothetical protein
VVRPLEHEIEQAAENSVGTPGRALSVWLIWFVLFIWLIWFIWLGSFNRKTKQTK